MKLHELAPAAGSTKENFRKGVRALATVKQQVKATKVRMLVPAAAFVLDLKAVRSRFPEDFPREVSITYLLKNMLL